MPTRSCVQSVGAWRRKRYTKIGLYDEPRSYFAVTFKLRRYNQEGRTALFVRVTTCLPNYIATCRGILEKQGLQVPGLSASALNFPTFESNVLYTLRFMVDRDIVGGNWIELPAVGRCSWHR